MLTTLVISWLITAVLLYAWFYFVEIVLDLPVTGHTPCTAHEALKNIVRRVLRDASKLVALQQPNEEQEDVENREGQTYEDLLATAILNKVIDNYQNDLRRSSSSSSSSKKEKDKSKPSKIKKSKTSSKNKVELEDPWKPQEIDSTSVSSVEDWCRSDCSWGEKRVDPVTLTIKHSIEELSSSSSSDLPASLLTPGPPSLDREGWEDNWLFSKRGSPKPVPVPMLVPSPNTELRAMIGDKDADDTSDLSETGSDVDDSVEVNSLKSILVDSRTIIGGKNLLDNINPELLEPHSDFKDNDSIPELHVHAEVIINGYHNGDTTSLEEETMENGDIQENGTDEIDGHIYKHEIKVEVQKMEDRKCNGSENGYSEAKNDVIISETPYVESDSLGSNTEKDAEYTEKYASFPRPIKKKSPVPSPRISVTGNDDTEINDILEQNVIIQNGVDAQQVSSEEEDPPVSFEGSYSAREKEKWKNPIALKNNPYSKENLDKRLQSRTNNSIFDREYYIRDAKKSASGKENEAIEVSSNDFQSLKSPSLTSSNEFTEDNIEIESEVPNKSVGVVQNGVSQNQDGEFQSEVDSSINSDLEIKIARPISLTLSSDEDNDVKRIYNVETGTIHKYKARDITKEIREDAKSPVGLKKFIGMKNTEEIFPPVLNEKFDENHNNSYENENIFEPEMKISSVQNLQTEVFNVPSNEEENRSYEEKVVSIDLSDEYSLDSQKENLSSIENVEMRDISKKYLNSLVKNKPYTVNNFSTSEVSIREAVPERKSVPVQSNLVKNEVKSQSCMDLSQREPIIQVREPILSSKLVSKYMKSVPNINDCVDSSTTDDISKNKSVNILEAEGIVEKPSVKDLMKLFDKKDNQDENKQNPSQLNVPTSSPKHVHSLTARSLPAGVRKELKIGTNEIDISARNGHKTEPIEEELKHISGISRSKIQFFEGLKK